MAAKKPVYKINTALKAFLVPIGKLREDPENANKHDERSIATIAASLDLFGQQKIIVLAPDGKTCKAGSGTLVAARDRLGWTHVLAVPSDLDDDALLEAYAITDNRASELSSWDYEVLAVAKFPKLIEAGVDLAAIGWTDFELEPLLKANWKPPEEGAMPVRTEYVTVHFTKEQWATVERAIDRCLQVCGMDGKKQGPGRSLELICADYSAGPG